MGVNPTPVYRIRVVIRKILPKCEEFLSPYGVNCAFIDYDVASSKCAAVQATIGMAEGNCTSSFFKGDANIVPTPGQHRCISQSALVYFTTHDINANSALLESMRQGTRIIVNVTSYMMRDLRHIHFVAAQLSSLSPCGEFDTSFVGSAGYLQHEVHSRNHQIVLQEPELHVLSWNDRAGVVGVGIHPKLIFHLRMDLA